MKIICIGRIKENFMEKSIKKKSKNIEIIELKNEKISSNPNISEIKKVIEIEGENILKKIQRDYVVALCVEGKEVTLEEFERIKSKNPTFIIGGSYGLSEQVKNRADEKISFSKMTFPHQLMRLVLVESL
ncbi:MAG: 23S rRNA (pseudouridine(1915)-N(3))-methyltransferase RlmH [Lachnospirales bacterium]